MGDKKQDQRFNTISGQPQQFEGQNIIRGDIVDRSNTLEFYKGSGDVIYLDKSGKPRKGHFNPRDNGYLLLAFLTQYPGRVFTADETVKVLKKERSDGDSGADRRVRDTIQTIRKELGLVKDKVNDFFIVEKGFSIGCKVELKP